MTLSPPVRVGALVGALVLTGVAAFLFLLGRGTPAEKATSTPAVAQHVRQTPAHTTTHAKVGHAPKAARRDITPGLPYWVARALRYNRVVVVSVYIPSAAVDAIVRDEARAAAKTRHAGFVAIGAGAQSALQRLVAKTGVLPDPAVVVIRRPGVVAATLGVSDRDTIGAAVLAARRGR